MQRVFRLGFFFLWPLLTGLAVISPTQHNQSQETEPSELSMKTAGMQEEWLGVYQSEEKVGYLHRRLIPAKIGYEWEEHWWLGFRRSNETHLTHTEVHARADQACALTSFSLWSSGVGTALYIKANVINQSASRQIIQGESINDGEATPFAVSLSLPLHLPPLCQMAIPIASRPGASREFSVFNPLSLQAETVSLVTLGSETIDLHGHSHVATKLASVMNDVAFYVWLDKEGRTLKEEIAPGVILQQENQEFATKGLWQKRGFTLPISTTDSPDSSVAE
ncbi:MAG: hypothetical protein AB7P69_15655 [Candidatus Binatia bacterium]